MAVIFLEQAEPDFAEERIFIGETAVDGAGGEACASGDAGDGGSVEAIFIQYVDCGFEQALEGLAAAGLVGGENGFGHEMILQKDLT